jgi:hypothetical protein
MIIKSLLFIIVLIFVYETFQKLCKMREEYFSLLDSRNEKFVDLTMNLNDKDKDVKNDISKTIAINCKLYVNEKNKIMARKEIPADELDKLEYSRFKPLKYEPKRLYYWRRDILIPEGIRRSMDDEKEQLKIKSLYDKETNSDKKKILKDELDLFNWRNNILELKDKKTKEERSMRDIITDYFPNEIGMSRPWREIHSHIPDYSDALNNGYKIYHKKQYLL